MTYNHHLIILTIFQGSYEVPASEEVKAEIEEVSEYFEILSHVLH